MASIHFNTVFLDGAFIGNIDASPMIVDTSSSLATKHNSHFIDYNSASVTGQLQVYKGVVPTFATLTDLSSRASDLLITFLISGSACWFNAGVVNNNRRLVLGIQGTPTSAAASGDATWFILYHGGGTTLTDRSAMIGTVGTAGSGADLELGDSAIVAGVKYTSTGVYFNFPISWTV
jgi:hypothetical protein